MMDDIETARVEWHKIQFPSLEAQVTGVFLDKPVSVGGIRLPMTAFELVVMDNRTIDKIITMLNSEDGKI